MAASPPNPRMRARIELMIRIAAPALDLTLGIADRVSRLIERDDPAYVTPRMGHSGASAPRGLSAYSVRAGDSTRAA